MTRLKTFTIDAGALDNLDKPERTRTWNPVSHGEAHKRLVVAVESAGIEVVDTRITISDDHQRAAGWLTLGLGGRQRRRIEALLSGIWTRTRATRY